MGTEPSKIRAGDSASWTAAFGDYPAGDGWALEFAIVGPGGRSTTTAGVASGDDFTCSLTADDTKALPPGQYRLIERVSKGAEVYTVYDGRIEILVNMLDAADGIDDRAHAELVLAAIEATILGRASSDQENITLNGQTLGRTPVADLIMLRKTYRREVKSLKAAERLAAGLGNKNKIRVRFK